MFSRTPAIAVLAIGCLTAVAGGAYVATRQAAPVDVPAAAAPATAGKPVSETEAVITAAAPSSAAPAESAPAIPAAAPETRPAAVAKPAAASKTSERATVAAPRADKTERARAPEPAPAKPTASSPAAPAPSQGDGTSTASAPTTPPSIPDAVREPVKQPELPAAPPVPKFEEVVIPEASVIGLRVETSLSSEQARVEDRVEARVTRDVMADGRVAVPAGSRVLGAVTVVERGGKVKERARLGVRFHTLVLADGREIPLRTDPVYRDGESPANDSSKKIGGAAVGGAILGAILGGGKGAAIGGAAGAAGGTAAVMAGDRHAATLAAGSVVTVKLSAPLSVDVQR
jgi:hypothetical protein